MIPKPPAPISNQAMADLLCTIMVLCKGVDRHKKPIWAYIAIKPSMATSFKEARLKGIINLMEYGSIIESGEGNEPPQDVQARMARDYGMNAKYEEELLAKVAALQAKNAS